MKKISFEEKQKNNIRAKKWYAQNTDRKKQYDKERHILKFEEISKKRKIYNARTKDKRDIKQKEYNLKPENKYNRAIRDTRKRGKTWDISLEDYLKIIANPCIYDGSDISKEIGSGLDRIDNSKGYLVSNVVPCCGKCNAIRGNRLSHEEMKVAMKSVLEFRNCSNKIL